MRTNFIIFTVLVSVTVTVCCLFNFIPFSDALPDQWGKAPSPTSKTSKVRYQQRSMASDAPTIISPTFTNYSTYHRAGTTSVGSRSYVAGTSSWSTAAPSLAPSGFSSTSRLYSSSSRSMQSYNSGSGYTSSAASIARGNVGTTSSSYGSVSLGLSSPSTLAFNSLYATNNSPTDMTALGINGSFGSTAATTRRRVIDWSNTNGSGGYWDDEEEEYVIPPTYPNGNPIDPLNPPTVGETYGDGEGNWYTWNGTSFIYSHTETNGPIGDGVWILLLLAGAMAVRRKGGRHRQPSP